MVKQIFIVAILLWAFSSVAAPPDGNAQIRARINDSEIVITTTRRLAGAIHSLTWRGQEFIDRADHGRQLQSASSFDNTATAGAETFNPTEAGSRDDGAGTNTTSHLLEIVAEKNHLRTKTQMAFWLAPGERSEGQLARNTNTLSGCVLTKDVTIGVGRWPQALDYRVTFSVPADEHHVSAQFEALTGYMPEKFNTFYEFNPRTKKLQPLTYGPGEIKNPIVLATADGRFAMGIFSPEHQSKTSGPTYGRWFFDQAHVAKWNCVFRVCDDKGIRSGDFRYRMFVPFGTVAEVETMLHDWSLAGTNVSAW
jgi:hypothetical protein